MRFKEFLTEEIDPVKEEKSRQKYFSPNEVLTNSQWMMISSDLDFHSFIQHPGQTGTVLVQPDEKYHNIFKIVSTQNLNNFIKYHITKLGKIMSKTVFSKDKPVNGNQIWKVVKHKKFE